MSSATYERMPGAAPGIDMYRDDYYKPHDQMGYINSAPNPSLPTNVPIPVGMFMAAPPPPHRNYYPGTNRRNKNTTFNSEMNQVSFNILFKHLICAASFSCEKVFFKIFSG